MREEWRAAVTEPVTENEERAKISGWEAAIDALPVPVTREPAATGDLRGSEERER
jgi:hypothetical protein